MAVHRSLIEGRDVLDKIVTTLKLNKGVYAKKSIIISCGKLQSYFYL